MNGNEIHTPSTPEKNGRYFEGVLEKENNRINALMSQAEIDLSSQSLSEESEYDFIICIPLKYIPCFLKLKVNYDRLLEKRGY